MVKQFEHIELSKEAALLEAVDNFLDFAWDGNNGGLRWQRRFFEQLLEGFIVSDVCQSVGDINRGDIVGLWFKIMPLLDAMEDYKRGTQTIKIVKS